MFSPFIFLYGPPASGKSVVGLRLASDLHLPFYDLDQQIELLAGKSISEIFAEEDERGFRTRESAALHEVLSRPAGVVALGGGALLHDQNRRLAEVAGRVVCLRAPFETILERLERSGGGRPLLDGDAQQRLQDLLTRREAHYASFPARLDSVALSVEDLAWQVQIRLGVFRSEGMGQGYDVRVVEHGLSGLGDQLKARRLGEPLALVCDENLARWHAPAAEAALRRAGYTPQTIVLPAGEEHKTFAAVQSLLESFLEAGLDRGSTVVAFGGGVVSDLAGFAAAIYLRGVRWVAVPTSLLAMVDASLGGKTGADLPQGKNLVGAFHPPSLVVADPVLLDTLPEVELRNGLAEVIKHGLLGDAELFERCCQGWEVIQLDLAEIVRRAIAVKLRVIIEDPYERGGRASLNLGHTLGHALELASAFRLKHGEAVAIGMVAAARLSERMGFARDNLSSRIESCLQGAGLPTAIPEGLDRRRLLEAMSVDKKRRAGRPRLVLPVAIGAARWGVEIEDPARLLEVMQS